MIELPQKKPMIFEVDDKNIKLSQSPEMEENTELDSALIPNLIKPPRSVAPLSKRVFSLGFMFISSITGLIGIWASAKLVSSLEALIARSDVLGYAALALTIIALTTLVLLIIKEIASLWGLKKLDHLRSNGQQLYDQNKLKPARMYLSKIKALYANNPERSWMLGRLQDHENEIMDGRELLELIDKELGSPLDNEARSIITSSSKKVSMITALAPGPFIDMAAVTILNVSMIRKIASVYGVRPGFWAQMRLAKNVLSHLALSGGIALTGDLLQPLIGTGIAAKLSKKLGEGLFNGALTIRIGLSAIELTRPIPHITTKPPSFSNLVTTALKPGQKG